MNESRNTIASIPAQMVLCAAFLLVIIGLPLAFAVSLVFRERYWSSPRPGKLGLEDVFRGFLGLSSVCGLATVVLGLVVLFFGH
jgi:hypothetical protein